MSDSTAGGPPHDHTASGGNLPGESNALAEFRQYREKMNTRILGENNLVMNRFFNLDGRAYENGALDVKTKELLGLVASLVLRCDDCITYHIVRCAEEGVTKDEVFETMSIGLIVGGSIVIPHLRRAVDRWDECEKMRGTAQ
ncbi:MAG: carboxymuconolactone decarboxylase family protein [Gemmatimonadaceae bacterium]|nr:carboxymuconolactone decarboxylase family protein [Gemmatimonadaceae bacterium]